MNSLLGKVTFLFLLFALSYGLQAASLRLSSTNDELITDNYLPHPVHISVTEINYSEKDKALQIISRLFIDDLELSIRAQRKEPELDLIDPKNGLTTQQLVINYLTEHFKIKIDGKLSKLKFLAVEREDLSLICYIEIENIKKIKTLEAYNDAIMGTHEDQSNLVHVTFKSPVKSARLTYNMPSEIFVFEKK